MREPQLLDHEYDGIQEWDNPTPGWWHMLFIGSIFFAAFYFVFWHFSEFAWTPTDALADARRREYRLLFAEVGEMQPDEPTILKTMVNPKWLAIASATFASNCAQCHGMDGRGITGPNLTDDTWINVKQVTDIFTVVSEGVAAKGMPQWKARLSQNERVLIAAYVASLRSSPKTGRAPEGQAIPPWPQPPAAEAGAQPSPNAPAAS